MGIRGELHSTTVSLPNRTYFFNVKENRLGDLYLNIVESKNKDTGGFERQSVVLFADDLQDFLKGFDESLKVMEKAVREKKRTERPARPATDDRRERKGREDDGKGFRNDRPFGGKALGEGAKPFEGGARKKFVKTGSRPGGARTGNSFGSSGGARTGGSYGTAGASGAAKPVRKGRVVKTHPRRDQE